MERNESLVALWREAMQTESDELIEQFQQEIAKTEITCDHPFKILKVWEAQDVHFLDESLANEVNDMHPAKLNYIVLREGQTYVDGQAVEFPSFYTYEEACVYLIDEMECEG